jgi:hypothetical protein
MHQRAGGDPITSTSACGLADMAVSPNNIVEMANTVS